MHALNGNTDYRLPDQTKIFPAQIEEVESTKTVEDMMSEGNAISGPDMSTWEGMLAFSSVMSTRSALSQDLNRTQTKTFRYQTDVNTSAASLQFPVSSWFPTEVRSGPGSGVLADTTFGRPLSVGGSTSGNYGYKLEGTMVKEEVMKSAGSAVTNLGRGVNISATGLASTIMMDLAAWTAPNLCMDLPMLKMVQLLHNLEYVPNSTTVYGKTHEITLADPYSIPAPVGVVGQQMFGLGRNVFNENCSNDPNNIPVAPYGEEVEVQFHVSTTSIASEAGDRWIFVPTWVQNMFPDQLSGLGPCLLAMCFAPKSYITSHRLRALDANGGDERWQNFATYADCVYLPGEDRIDMVFAKSVGTQVPYDQNTANANIYTMPKTGSSAFITNGVNVPPFSVLNMSYNTNLNNTVTQPSFGGQSLTMAQWIYSFRNDITAVRVRQFLRMLGAVVPINNSLAKAAFAAGWLFTSVRYPIATVRGVPVVYDPASSVYYESMFPNGYQRKRNDTQYPIDVSTLPIDFTYPACEPAAWTLVSTALYYVSGVSSFDKVKLVNSQNITTFESIMPIYLSDSRMLYHTSFEGMKIACTYSVLWAKIGISSGTLFNSINNPVNPALAQWAFNLGKNIDGTKFYSTDFNYGVKALYCSLWECAFPSLLDTGEDAWFGDCFEYPNAGIGGVVVLDVPGANMDNFVPQMISDAWIQLVVNHVPRMLMSWSSPFSPSNRAANTCIAYTVPKAANSIVGNPPTRYILNLDPSMSKNINNYDTSDIYWQDDSTIWNARLIMAGINTSILYATYYGQRIVTIPSNTLVFNQFSFTNYNGVGPFQESMCACSCVYPRVSASITPLFLSHDMSTDSGLSMVQAIQQTTGLSPAAIIAGNNTFKNVEWLSEPVKVNSKTVGTGIRTKGGGKKESEVKSGSVSISGGSAFGEKFEILKG